MTLKEQRKHILAARSDYINAPGFGGECSVRDLLRHAHWASENPAAIAALVVIEAIDAKDKDVRDCLLSAAALIDPLALQRVVTELHA